MSLATLRRGAARLRAQLEQRRAKEPTILDRIRQDPAEILALAGMEADPWQTTILRSRYSQTLFNCSRQSGKSSVAAALSLRTAFLKPGSLTLLLSPTLRQSSELFRDKVLKIYRALGRPVPAARESALQLELSNGSRIVSLPGSEGTVRGFSAVSLLIVDEASRVKDELYHSVRPMLAVSKGDLVCLSTPFGKRGWFFEAWSNSDDWHKVQVKAEDCPRISREFLDREREEIGEYWYRQEYEVAFLDLVGSLFSEADIDAAMSDGVLPLFGE